MLDAHVEGRLPIVVVARPAAPSRASRIARTKDCVQGGRTTAVTIGFDPINFQTPLTLVRFRTIAVITDVESACLVDGGRNGVDVRVDACMHP